MRKVAVVAAHADDEVLGCGGTLAKHSARGDTIHVIYMTPNITSRKSDDERLDMERRRALAILGNGNITFKVYDFADQMLDRMGQLKLVQAIESELIPYNPDIIYTHSETDLNEDHRQVCQAVLTAARPWATNALSILSFEVLSSPSFDTAFSPNYWEHIGWFIKQKCKAMNAYRSELRRAPHPRTIRQIQLLAEYRGAQVYRDYAEAFRIQWGRSEVCR